MSEALTETAAARGQSAIAGEQQGFATFQVAGQVFGIPVTKVQDILTPEAIARVPLGPSEVRGLINLRGRIVTVIDVRTRLALGAGDPAAGKGMCVTVENDAELYTLLVDSVGDVVSLPSGSREPVPATLDAAWSEIANGVFRMGEKLLVVLDIPRLLDIRKKI